MRGCDRCEFGWRTVSPGYPAAQVPMPDLSGLPEDLREVAEREVLTRRAGLVGAVYPCKECQTALFFRWAAGHLESKHDEENCEECSEIRRGKKPSGLSLAAPGPPVSERDKRMDF